ncbi:FKBP-type peptidyl-prolyl cis-trans isomerase [Agromyces seonyuensis]|uniref:Peptidyl-prolyl cis-trans isomerase n=1 Tax=Agromyces seonyuensis TaxID=2662446 RepID=A0A6I4P1D3_9MICO|nr:hypothetical protein [Agromyces seonyuensis]
MRKYFALIATGGLIAVALTGCAAPAEPQATSGATVDAVHVSGEFGETPDVEFPTPLTAQDTQCREVIEGEGDYLSPGQFLELGLYWANGTTGEVIATAGFDDEQTQVLTPSASTTPAPLVEGLSCARDGSRVVVTTTAEEFYGPDRGNDAQGIAPGDTLVFVMDVIKAYPDRADGAVRLSRDGFPAVVLDGDGRPGVTVPSSGPFEDLEVETLKQGSGATVEDGDLVVVNFTGVLWDDNTVFDTTWKDEGTSPTVWSVGEGGNIPTGLSDALIGKTVGSQVVVVVPPDQGYGSSGSGEIPADATLVYVVDILGIYGDE